MLSSCRSCCCRWRCRCYCRRCCCSLMWRQMKDESSTVGRFELSDQLKCARFLQRETLSELCSQFLKWGHNLKLDDLKGQFLKCGMIWNWMTCEGNFWSEGTIWNWMICEGNFWSVGTILNLITCKGNFWIEGNFWSCIPARAILASHHPRVMLQWRWPTCTFRE